MRQSEERRLQNKAVRTRMKSAIKGVLSAESPEKAQAALPDAMKRIDKAAKSHAIHKNTASRYKSRVARAIAAR